ncbi:zinc-ribbon domain containing protein [Candidatus Albibeggiatoa sp. nov. NOAA]|uniref:zinc-ribbon domain containing protein n=1 Tax=Candidatus Albibeggiatoa sp. nov. NOAA TaxID=3162724 RepID=UPI0032F2F3E3|nr:zinc-ribbon domain-containing protein [Thiotrichaceae bacterium]
MGISKKRCKNSKNSKYVDHPRYGNLPIPSRYQYSIEEIKRANCHYAHLKCFPETAIPANIEKQKYGYDPRILYVDVVEHCKVCGRPFIFFAKEQQYWFEELGFWVDAHCTKCCDCRAKDHAIKTMLHKYEKLVKKLDKSETETRQLKQIALELYQQGYIQNVSKVNRIKLKNN